MNHFKKKVLATAVLATMAGAAQAVYVDPNGLGQGLIYPYYTVQNGHNTYVSVVNTTSVVKVVKVRFREGKASKEVLDFNLYLSPNDVWTAAVIPSPSSAAGRIVTADTSCTNPAIPTAGVDFRNYLYSGRNDDGAGDGLDRTREGYLEILEMATLNPSISPGNAAVHNSAGVPANCARLQGNPVASLAANGVLLPPTGGLSGTGTLINVTNGQDSGYNAVALAALGTEQQYAEIGNDNPNFNTALVEPNSIVIDGTRTVRSLWDPTFPVDAVSSVLMHSSVINEYVLDTGTNSNTDWVLTFPTKQFYVLGSTVYESNITFTPFTGAFGSRGACEAVSVTFFNREEATQTPDPVDFSPAPPVAPRSLCWESTVLSIRNGAAHMPTGGTSGVLGSVNTTAINITPTFQNGWAQVNFTSSDLSSTVRNNRQLFALSGEIRDIATGNVTASTPTFAGLPVVGFMVRTFNNGTLGNFQANYGSAFGHKYKQTITGQVNP